MAKLVKTFIGQLGGMASKVTSGEFFGEAADKTESADGSADGSAADDASSCTSAKSPTEISSKLSLSSGDEDRESHGGAVEEGGGTPDAECPVKKGYLSKWTNYLHGWQDRYVVVAHGILSYYKSESDTQYGCRGSISLHQVRVLLHEFDELRFDIRVRDCTYFFRAATCEERLIWTDSVEANKREVGFPVSTIRRQASILSLSAISQASTSSFKIGHDFHSKLAEMETYRDILCRQIDVLQAYFDTLADQNSTARFNGVHQSAESFERLSEEEAASSESDDILPKTAASTPNSPFTRPSSNHPATTTTATATKSATLPPPPPSHPSQPSPLTHHRSQHHHQHQISGHRRTGSDPFSFTKPVVSSRLSNHHAHIRTSASLHHVPINVSSVDFRGEAITFKATTAGIISALSHCIETMAKREEYWQKKCEREEDKRRKAEMAAHAALNGPRVRAYHYAGPDFEEGPHSALNEEEFFDALEMAYQCEEQEHMQEEEEEENARKKTPRDRDNTDGARQSMVSYLEESPVPEATSPEDITHKPLTGITHRMSPLVTEKVTQYARYLFEVVDNNWNMVYEDGDMKVYRREQEEGGVVVDPLKSFYTATGVSAREMANYFFEYDTRMEWEGTIESAIILETLCEDTIVFHHLHKRVWPSTQRETVFCSHICTLPNAPRADNQIGHTWMVGNFSIDHPKAPISSKLIRATFQCGLVCQTISKEPVQPGKEAQLARGDLACKIHYATNVNPGGWAPPAVVRTIGKREITKFLKKFSSAAQKRTASTPLTL